MLERSLSAPQPSTVRCRFAKKWCKSLQQRCSCSCCACTVCLTVMQPQTFFAIAKRFQCCCHRLINVPSGFSPDSFPWGSLLVGLATFLWWQLLLIRLKTSELPRLYTRTRPTIANHVILACLQTGSASWSYQRRPMNEIMWDVLALRHDLPVFYEHEQSQEVPENPCERCAGASKNVQRCCKILWEFNYAPAQFS